MTQRIEAPNDEDIDRIARMLIWSQQCSARQTGEELDGSLEDLRRIQRILDGGSIDAAQTMELQCLGLAFGNVFVKNNDGYDWWMAEDEYGRDPCVRYLETSLVTFPQTMISKRIEDGETVVIEELYDGLVQRLEAIRQENYADR